MKKLNKNSLLFGLLILGLAICAQAQVQYNGCTVTGTYASAVGKNNTASGNNSFAGGYTSQATGSNSFAFGYNSKATQSTTAAIGNTAIASGVGSMAVGNYVKATAQNAFVLGTGTTASYPLTNSTESSIAFGINSNKPTMLITKSLNNNYTGKVAIGSTTTPQAKLHIKSDNNEDAGIFLEPTNKSSYKSFIKLYDDTHSITVDKTAAMELNSGTGALNFKGANYCLGTLGERKMRIYTSTTPTLYINASRVGTTENRDGNGSSLAIDFTNNGFAFRSALYQEPRSSEITNWRNLLYLCTDGKIGLGSRNTYLENSSDNNLKLYAPNAMALQSSNITLTGKIGINTTNNTNGYALAVDGGIISTKVYIKEVKLWPDYVFADNYSLMDLDELKQYLNKTHHLPGVPSEEDILNNGYDMGEMQSVMMEKIEELTRYILMLQDEIKDLKSSQEPSADTIAFTYDNNGNRIARNIVFQRITDPERPNLDTQSLSYDLFPNPTSGTFSVLLKQRDDAKATRATLLTSNGVVIDEKEIAGNQASFDLSNQSIGVYILEIDSPEGHQTWKVIKR